MYTCVCICVYIYVYICVCDNEPLNASSTIFTPQIAEDAN